MSRSSRRAPAQSEEEQNGQENDAIEVAHILQNCDYTRLHPVCNTLMNDLSQRINRMDEIIKPSIQAAISWTRRHQQGVGVSQQTVMNDPTIVDKLTSCRESIRISCIKQCELSILRDLLQTVSSECIQGRLPPNRNWIEWFQQQGQTIEADPETMRKKQEKVEKVLHLFDRQTKYSPPSDAPHDPAHAVDAGSDDSNAHDPGVDGDIDVIDQTDSSQLSIHDVTCKLSLGLYHEPMRNEACPHTYSKREILNHLTHKYHQQSGSPLSRRDASPSSSSNLPNEFECLCPIAGCKKMVALATLTPDETMARKVKQFHQQKSQQSATHATVATAASSSSSSASSTGRPSRKRGRVKEEDLTQSEE